MCLLEFADDFVFHRGLRRFADPDFMEHDLVSAATGNFLEALAQTKTESAGMVAVGNDLPADPIGSDMSAKGFGLPDPLAPGISRGQTQAWDNEGPAAEIASGGFVDPGVGEGEQEALMAARGDFDSEPPGVVTHTVHARFKATADEKDFQGFNASWPTFGAPRHHVSGDCSRLEPPWTSACTSPPRFQWKRVLRMAVALGAGNKPSERSGPFGVTPDFFWHSLWDTRLSSTVNNSSRIALFSAFFIGVALFYAPLAYGCTRPEMLPALYALLIAAMVTGTFSFVKDQRWPVVPRTVRVCSAALLAQGWFLTWNPTFPSLVAANQWTVDVGMEKVCEPVLPFHGGHDPVAGLVRPALRSSRSCEHAQVHPVVGGGFGNSGERRRGCPEDRRVNR